MDLQRGCSTTWAVLAWLCAISAAGASGFEIESAGARFGFRATKSGEEFLQADVVVTAPLPWRWDLGKTWRLDSRIEATGGWLGETGESAAIFTAGPKLILGVGQFPLSLQGGISPTLLTRSDFPSKDFGIPFQFTTHVGLNLEVGNHVGLGYRFQHMSNGGLGPTNPGLNLHMISLSYRF